MCRCPQAYKKTVCIHNELNTDGFYIVLIRFISDKIFRYSTHPVEGVYCNSFSYQL